MEEKISGLPSLPPDLDGKIFGFLKIEVGNLVWLKAPYDPMSVLIRVKFWGDKSDGVLLRTADSKRHPYSNKAEYTIRNTQPLFIKYLCDMSVLTLDVIDSAKRRLIGTAKINLKLYLRRDENSAKGKLASNSRFSNIEVEGAFPIMRTGDNADKLGELEISIFSDFHKWKNEVRNSKELMDSFQMNELRAEFDNTLPTRPMAEHDDRVPNSYALRPIQEEQQHPLKPHDFSKDIIKLSKSAVKKISDPRKSPAPQPYRQEQPKAPYIPPEPEYKYQPTEDKPLTASVDLELEAITKRAELLRKRMEESARDNYQAILHGTAEPNQVELPLPTLAEIEALEMPIDPTVKFKPLETDEVKSEKPFYHLTNMKQLILNITTLTVLCDRSLVKDKFIYLECILPVPSLSHPLSSIKNTEDKKGVFIRTDSLKISHKGGYDNVFTFNHESVHDLGIGEGVYGKLANQSIRFRLWASDGKKGDIEIGKAEVLWEKILISPGFSYSVVLEFVSEDTAKRKTRKTVAGRLSAKFSLVPEKGRIYEDEVEKSPEEKTAEFKDGLSTVTFDPKSIEKARSQIEPPEEGKLYQLFLYIDSAYQIQLRSDNTSRNIYISYKTFPQNERIKTQVIWNYEDSESIDHKIILPIVSSAQIIEKLYNALLVLEVWDKTNTNTEELLGLVKLPLKLFATFLSSGQAASTGVYPLIAFDEYRAINSLKSGQDVGYLKICLAMGSVSQVHMLEMAHTGKKEIKEHVQREEKLKMHTPTKDNFEESKILDYSSRVIPRDISDHHDILNQSVESISDIAAILNNKPKEEYIEPTPIRAMTPSKIREVSKPEMKKPKSGESEPEPSRLPEPNRRSLTDLATELRSNLLHQNIDILTILSKSDLPNKNYVSRDFLLDLLSQIQPSYTSEQLSNLIAKIVSESSSSSPDHIYKPDILSFLNLPSIAQPNIAHVFNLHIIELYSTQILSSLPSRSCYLKVMFPLEDGYIESDLLEPNDGKSISLNLKSKHTYTLPSYTNLTEHMSSTPGICIYLCRNVERSHEMVIAKAILPVEEILEMEDGTKMNRVMCLYADTNEAVRSFGHDIIGKLKLMVHYSTYPSYEKLSHSSELVIEKETRVDRLIPRNNLLTVFIDKAGDLQKAERYYRSQGINLDSSECYVRINLFQEDVKLSNSHGLLLSNRMDYANGINFTERLQLEINIDDAILDYFKSKAAVVEIVSLLQSNEEIVIGSARVNLVPLLLNNLLAGEFALLNDYGQFMGWVNLSISMLLEDARPSLYSHSKTNKDFSLPPPKESPPSFGPKSKTLSPPRLPEPQEKSSSFLQSNVARDIEARMLLWNQSLEYQADDEVKKLHAKNMKDLDNIFSSFDTRKHPVERQTSLHEKCEKFIRHHSPIKSEPPSTSLHEKCEKFIRHHSPLHNLETLIPRNENYEYEDPNLALQNTLKQTEDLLLNLRRKQIEISQTINPYDNVDRYEESRDTLKPSVYDSYSKIEQLKPENSPHFMSYDVRESVRSDTSFTSQKVNYPEELKHSSDTHKLQPENVRESMESYQSKDFYNAECVPDDYRSYIPQELAEPDPIYTPYKSSISEFLDPLSSYPKETEFDPELEDWDHNKVQDILSVIREAEMITGSERDILQDHIHDDYEYRAYSPCGSPPSTHSEPLTFAAYSQLPPIRRSISPEPELKPTRFRKDPEIDRIANIMKRKF